MSEYVMLIASAKIPAGKRCDFSLSYIKLSATPHHHHLSMIKAPPKSKN